MNGKAMERFIEFWNHWGAGNGIIGTPIRILAVFGSVIAGLDAYDIVLPPSVFVVIGLCSVVFITLLGWLWNNKGFQEAHNEFQNKRNLFTKEMRKKIK